MRSNEIVPLAPTEYASTGGHVYRTVFVDPAGTEPFSIEMVSRGLVHPVKFKHPPDLMAAIAQVGLEMGDTGAFLTIQGLVTIDDSRSAGEPPFPNHWWLPLTHIGNYQKLRGAHLVCENELFSESGQWGVAAILDGAALLGGRDGFAERVMMRLGLGQDSQVESYLNEALADISAGPPGYTQSLNIPGIEDLFTHLFGCENAKRYLASLI